MAAVVCDEHDLSLVCGAPYLLTNLISKHPSMNQVAEEAGLWAEILALHHRAIIDPSGKWWLDTHDRVDVQSTRMSGLWAGLSTAKSLPSVTTCGWWKELVEMAIDIVKANAKYGLSARDTMCSMPVRGALRVIEVVANDEESRDAVLDNSVVDALEYATAHDFLYMGAGHSAHAAGAVLALVGRNEGGKH